MKFRSKVVAVACAGLVIAGLTTGVVAAAVQNAVQPVECSIDTVANSLLCPLPAPPAPVTVTAPPVTVTAPPVTTTATATVTQPPVTSTVTVTATPTPTSSTPPSTPTSSTPPSTPTSSSTPTTTTTTAPAGCDRNATTSTFAAQVSAATAGQTICLAAGSYGTWAGTNKAVTIKAAASVVANMKVNFGSGDQGFTLDGLSGMGGQFVTGAKNVTIRNSTFTSSLDLQGQAGANILIEGNKFDWAARYSGGINAKLFIYSNTDGAPSGVTVKGNSFRNGDLDGVHIGGSAGADILNNVFLDLCASGSNHTDMLQTEGMVGGRIAGNLFKAGLSCEAQALTSYDGGTVGVLIEDNVIDVHRPWGIEWYSDKNSIIRHNTVVWYPASQCNFNTPCGRIDINRKSADPAGSGTQVYDNLAVVEFNTGSTGTQRNNASAEKAKFVSMADWAGYKLAADSPVGLAAASDGLNLGIR